MKIHIGNIIKGKLKHKQIDITSFAKRINCTRRNVYKILEKPSIDTELLLKIGPQLAKTYFFILSQHLQQYSYPRSR